MFTKQSLQSFIFISKFILILSLYEDQIGKFDWHQQYVGSIKYLQLDQSNGQFGRRILVGTNENILAAINSRKGDVGWRHILESNNGSVLNDAFIFEEYFVALSNYGASIRCFHSTTGVLKWESSNEIIDPRSASLSFLHHQSEGELVIVLTDTKLIGYQLSTGKQKLVFSLRDDVHYRWLFTNSAQIHLVGFVDHSHIIHHTYSLNEVVREKKIAAAWIHSDSGCIVVKMEIFVCLEKSTSSLQFINLLSDAQAFRSTLIQDLGINEAKEFELLTLPQNKISSYDEPGSVFSLKHGRNTVILKAEENKISLKKTLPGVTASCFIKYGDSILILTAAPKLVDLIEFKAYSALSFAEVAEVSLRARYYEHHGVPRLLRGMLFNKKDGSVGFRILTISTDNSFAFYQQNGHLWTREESLASIVSTELVDLPVSETEALMEEEFGNTQTHDIFSMFLKRVTLQLIQIKDWILNLQNKLIHAQRHASYDADESYENSEFITRDSFNLHKMIIAVTSVGKLFGIHSQTGRIVWRVFLPHLHMFNRFEENQIPIFVQRTTAHFPHPPQCTIIAKHKSFPGTLIYSFNPITGQPISDIPPGGQIFDYSLKQVTMLSEMDERAIRPILLLDTNLKYHCYPASSSSLVREVASAMYMFTADSSTGDVEGFNLVDSHNKLIAQPIWKINLPISTQLITNVIPKRQNEHVHSQGIVLGDRSVLYKYLNPNMVVILTEGSETPSDSQKTLTTQDKKFFTLYLIDVITGNIVFHCNHKRAHGPIHIVHSENWVVYSYHSSKHRRNEIAVLELYEGNSQGNATAFSSLTPPAAPFVMRQSFISPGHITKMSATITEKGITSKHIIISLSNGAVLQMPKFLLDPRRPLVPTVESQEEGLLPYMPEIPRPFESTINYNRSVYHVRGIHTSPAGLESTSLVFCYGLDLFFVPVYPSKMFDVLKEDFDYYFISSVLIGMIIVSLITKKLASRKSLYRAWK